MIAPGNGTGMPPTAAIVDPLDPSSVRPRQAAWRDAALIVSSAAAVAGAYLAAREAIPVATAAVLALSTAAAMHGRLATGRWRAAAGVLAAAALLSAAAAPPRLVGAVLISGLSAAALIARCTGRSAVLRAGAWTALIAGAASLSGVAATVSLPAVTALREAFAAAAGALLGAPLLLTLGPLAEWVFGHTTRLTIGEWLSYEHPLLRELATAAPGTFQHSVNVGVLADAAAAAIHADALIARAGGLYHDVGKIRAPGCFIENQHGPNPHDDLAPWESARILRAHVTDGLELTRAHGVGGRIADFVREHHGTSTMRVFSEKAASWDGPGPAGETYRYHGPPPQSRETALVMIADQREATARATPPADEAACDAIVRRTVARIRDETQFDASGLTGRDFELIQPAFSRALLAMSHRRFAYPGQGPAARPRRRFAFVPRMLTRRRAGG